LKGEKGRLGVWKGRRRSRKGRVRENTLPSGGERRSVETKLHEAGGSSRGNHDRGKKEAKKKKDRKNKPSGKLWLRESC